VKGTYKHSGFIKGKKKKRHRVLLGDHKRKGDGSPTKGGKGLTVDHRLRAHRDQQMLALLGGRETSDSYLLFHKGTTYPGDAGRGKALTGKKRETRQHSGQLEKKTKDRGKSRKGLIDRVLENER